MKSSKTFTAANLDSGYLQRQTIHTEIMEYGRCVPLAAQAYCLEHGGKFMGFRNRDRICTYKQSEMIDVCIHEIVG